MNQVPRAERVAILETLHAGKGLRATTRKHSVSSNTVTKLLRAVVALLRKVQRERLGEHAATDEIATLRLVAREDLEAVVVLLEQVEAAHRARAPVKPGRKSKPK